jgi:hypothetical protein
MFASGWIQIVGWNLLYARKKRKGICVLAGGGIVGLAAAISLFINWPAVASALWNLI